MRPWFSHPKSKVDVWSNTGHQIMQDRKDDVNAATTAWIDMRYATPIPNACGRLLCERFGMPQSVAITDRVGLSVPQSSRVG